MCFNFFLWFIQVFNVDETGLIWKKMPGRTLVPAGLKNNIGFKQAKERVTLLLGSNASGDCKLKPLLINKYAKPNCFKKQVMSDLPVYWASNHNAWMTGELFNQWLKDHFVPDVTAYLTEINKEVKILLLVDNATSHKLDDENTEKFPFLTVEFLPPNTTSIIQPMDQGVIANFKRIYLTNSWAKVIVQYSTHIFYNFKNVDTTPVQYSTLYILYYSTVLYVLYNFIKLYVRTYCTLFYFFHRLPNS